MTVKIDYDQIIQKYPWILERDQNCILSPDSDGLLCGLFMSHYLGWKIRGFYDTKVLVLEKGFKPKDCIFLDVEIFRKGYKSIGQHMVLHNKKRIVPNWDNFGNCMSPNNMRMFDVVNDFPIKYPFGTIHLLLGLIGSKQNIDIPVSGICPLLYTDGTFKNLFNYPDNCLDWLNFFGADKKESSLHTIFFNDHYTVSNLMIALKDLFSELRTIAKGRRGGDKISFSNGAGEIINFNKEKFCLEIDTVDQACKFLALMEEKTGWAYNSKSWSWNNLEHYFFKKEITQPGLARYNEVMAKNPVSFAITSTDKKGFQYTLDPNGILSE